MHHLKKARRLSIVPRWSIIPTIRQQNVAEHSFQVAVLTRYLVSFHAESSSRVFFSECLIEALGHDMEEAVEGDMPGGPVKKKDFEALTKEKGQVWAVVKMADMLEAYLFLEEERALGNAQVKPITLGYHQDIDRLLPCIDWVLPPSRMTQVIGDLVNNSLGLDMGDFANGG